MCRASEIERPNKEKPVTETASVTAEASGPAGRDLVPAQWTMTARERELLARERELLAGVDLDAVPQRARHELKHVLEEHGVTATTAGYRLATDHFRARADLRKAINDEREEEVRLERLAGEETEVNKLRRDHFRVTNELAKANAEASKQARLKEIAISERSKSQ